MLLHDIDTAFLQDADRTVAHDVDVLLRDGAIVAVDDDLTDAAGAAERRDCSDRVALPGLINCHTHTPNLLTRGWSDAESLFPWLDSVGPLHDRATEAQLRAAARLTAALLLRTGTTTLNDMWGTAVADDLAATGVRALLGATLTDRESTPEGTVEERLASNRSFVESCRSRPRLHPAVPVHSVYWGSASLFERAHDLATSADVPLHVHVSETREENDRWREAHGTTPTAWLDELGVLDDRAILAHGVHLTDDDRRRIGAAGAGIAHCPAANLKLGSGIADVPAMTAAGIPVGIGTDSAASNNALDLFHEAHLAALVHKRADPAAITAQRVLDMLTREAATVLGLADEIGSLEAGKRADIVLLDRTAPTLSPSFGDAGLLSNLLYAHHGGVTTTIVEGEVVVDDGSLTTEVDVAAAAATVQTFAATALDRADRPAPAPDSLFDSDG